MSCKPDGLGSASAGSLADDRASPISKTTKGASALD
jgi:hypothetical protein